MKKQVHAGSRPGQHAFTVKPTREATIFGNRGLRLQRRCQFGHVRQVWACSPPGSWFEHVRAMQPAGAAPSPRAVIGKTKLDLPV